MTINIKIGKHTLGPGKPAFIVAEMSGNHGGSVERAKEIVRAAKDIGADALKLQTYTPDTITLKSEKEDFLLPSSSPWSARNTLYELYSHAYTPWEWHKEIFDEGRRVGIDVFSAPFDESAVDLLESLDCPAYKIASPEITHIPLIKRVAQTKKPVIISSGLSTLEDLSLAVDTLKKNGCKDIIILKCTSSYPAPLEEANLLTIPDMMKQFNCLSGLSDHTPGIVAPVVAVSLGASLIEKHFIIDKNDTSEDAFFSLDKEEFTQMIKAVRDAEKSMGKVDYTISESAMKSLRGRRSLYVSASIKRGDVISAENIKSVRPSFGLHPKHFEEVIGKRARQDLSIGDRLSWDVLE